MKEIKKIALVGVHGVGKSTICKKIHKACYIDYSIDVMFIPEQFREVVKDIDSSQNDINNSENITLATYAKQLYLENLYTAQEKNILCDRSVLDTFVYYNYFNICSKGIDIERYQFEDYFSCAMEQAWKYKRTYSKVYLIEPSDRLIEDDGFRMTNKQEQLKVHNLFLEYFRNFDNVEIINQEDAHKEEFINKVVSEFVL